VVFKPAGLFALAATAAVNMDGCGEGCQSGPCYDGAPVGSYNYNYCGYSWTDANSRCATSCASGTDAECPAGEACYADCTACPMVQVGTFSPTTTQVPSFQPSTSISPSASSQPSAGLGDCEMYKNTVNFGYYQSWAIYRSWSCNPLQPDGINVAGFGYTHLAYAFAGINGATGQIEPYNGVSSEFTLYTRFNSLKTSNPGLKTLIAIGGWTFDQTRFSDVSSTTNKRTTFANSVVTFLESHGFDGIDLDWEYPVTRQGTPEDYANYPLLCEALRTAFNNAGHSDWLITIATSINADTLARGYDMVAMAPHVDWFNIMSYDIHGAWDSTAGANADLLYITNTINYILDLGIPREKLVLGLAAYGRSSRLTDPSCITDGCPISGAGLTGCHGEQGNLPYFQINESYVLPLNYNSLILNSDTSSMELVTGGNIYFTSFDNVDTFNIKYQYAYEKCMRGIMWWAVDLIKYPLVLQEFSEPTSSPTLTTQPSTSSVPSTAPSTSVPPSQSLAPTGSPTRRPTLAPVTCGAGCPVGSNEMFPTLDCSGFYYCVNGVPSSNIYCAAGTLYDVNIRGCNWDYTVTCQCTSGTAPTTLPAPGMPTPLPTSLPTPSTSTCGTCPTSGWALVASLGCSGFYHCFNGVPRDYIACPANTLFDNTIQGCDYDYRVTCACAGAVTSTPIPGTTPRPTANPTPYPTAPSTNPWYPDWSNTNTCQNDGNQPSWMTQQYFSSTKELCCKEWYWWDPTCV